ncbi:MAG: glycine C-acetyltransferase [Zetaproteobacteria bacterium]|nr:glycine C-acetyltransferase [Pseudobdellovibrionaceae bacterium]
MTKSLIEQLAEDTEQLKREGLFKSERIITSPQQPEITSNGQEVINLCANNYLGLSNHPQLLEQAIEAIPKYGFGLSSVRFICGTQDIHKTLENKLSEFLGTEDTILYSSCFDANAGLFETILGPEDAIISDALNHASIIDGIRLCKAKRFRYKNKDMADLEAQLKASKDCRYRLIATDGVFSMDGTFADLQSICDLADKYDALVMVDDSHAVGFVGPNGRGTPEACKVIDRIDLITGTLGKALGGASGGYTSGRREIIEWLRQRSRPYLFSNTLAPVIAATSCHVLDMLMESNELITKVNNNATYFRNEMEKLGFDLIPGSHPIIPIMLGDAKLATQMADDLMKENIYVIGFSFPVVPKGQARIRTQVSAAHSKEDLTKAIEAFAKVGRKLKVIQ